jgi:hypothetical protein
MHKTKYLSWRNCGYLKSTAGEVLQYWVQIYYVYEIVLVHTPTWSSADSACALTLGNEEEKEIEEVKFCESACKWTLLFDGGG